MTVNVKELQRNNIQFTAGYSGYEGTFVAISYSTVNFLGAGENLEITAQYGKRIRNYSFGFTEPYVFDYPVSLGFNIYDRYVVYPYLYDRKDKGIDLTFGARLIGYWRVEPDLQLPVLNIKSPSQRLLDDADDRYVRQLDIRCLDHYYMSLYGWGNYNMSSHHSLALPVDDRQPPDALAGERCISLSLKYAGTFLGGGDPS